MDDLTPITRREMILSGKNLEPITRKEWLLQQAAQGGGGGGSAATNYNTLQNRPSINGVTLSGNKTSAQLGLEGTMQWDSVPTSGSNKAVRSGGVYSAIATVEAAKVDKVSGKGLSTEDYTTAEKTKLAGITAGAQPNVIEKVTLNGVEIIPANKAVALSVITRTVNNLQNYYLKTETYTQAEVNALINNISSLTLDIVTALPTTDISTTTIYLLETETANVYMQYAYINNEWAQLGTTQADFSDYYNKSAIDVKLADKQDVLTFDEEPTAASDNPVKSGGVANALATKQDTLTFDSTPTEDSTNPVESGGVYAALEGKQNTLEYDTEPTLGSDKMLTSGAVKNALDNITVDVATDDTAGIVKPDGTTITVDNDGTLHGSSGIVPDEGDFDFTEGVLSLQTSRRMWTGTTADWDNLSTAEKQQYSVANFTDDESGTPEYYSTTETKTNKIWIDGKPIYRKVYSGLSTNYVIAYWTNLGIYISSLNIDTLLFVRGISTVFNNERFDISADQLRIAGLIDSATLTNLIIEYTKTTD